MNNTYKTFLFDWDGTIVNTHPAWEAAWNGACLDYGITMSYKQASREIFGKFEISPLFASIGYKTFLDKMYRILDSHLNKVQINPGVTSLLKKLRASQSTCIIVTSSQRHAILPLIKKYKLEAFFNSYLTCEDVTKLKPDPEIIHKAISISKSEKKDCVIIGDSSADILAGQAAGIDTILYSPPQNHLAHDIDYLLSLNPSTVITNFDELL